jgi:MORN repeat
MKHGFGKYFFENGDIYEGTWKNDAKHGVGTYKYKEAQIMIRATWVDGSLKGPIEVFYPNFRYHGYWNKKHPVGEGAFSFGMKYMLQGHYDFYPNPDFVEQKGSETSQSESNDVKNDVEVSLFPRCLPQFVAHNIQAYDYSKLPQQPMPLPTSDSISTVCTSSTKSDSEVQVYKISSPILIAADLVDAEDLVIEQEKETRIVSD